MWCALSLGECVELLVSPRWFVQSSTAQKLRTICAVLQKLPFFVGGLEAPWSGGGRVELLA